jgi:microcystin-dependent protein
MVCDGKRLSKTEYQDLYQAITNSWGETGSDFLLPDLRGQFLRGVDSSGTVDPDAAKRFNKMGVTVGSVVGSFQNYATSRPSNTPFKTDDQGAHSHSIPPADISDGGEWKYNAIRTGLNPQMKKDTGEAGSHHHTVVSGGDPETRPKNAGVYWLIRVK